MKKIVVSILLIWVIVGCAGKNENHYEDVVNKKVSSLPLCSQPLSSFSDFKIEKMIVSNAVMKQEDKVVVAKQLENKIKERVAILVEEWEENPKEDQSGTLLIKPELHTLRIVSEVARTWLGAMVGNSSVSMELTVIEESTGKEICKPKIDMSANAWAGYWTGGETDRNLLNYIADVSAEYLNDNY